jgi:hypothetical protein
MAENTVFFLKKQEIKSFSAKNHFSKSIEDIQFKKNVDYVDSKT